MTHTSDKHVTDEELELVTRGKADGIYMKAPNGSPTSLNERQWVQVRTRAFKNWFGDWENVPEAASRIPDDKYGNEQWTEEGYVYDLYVNSRNPFDPKDGQAVKKILQSLGSEIPVLSFYGGKGGTVSPEKALELASSKRNCWMLTETPEFLSKVREAGYDGLVGYDEGVKYIAVMSPGQLKDAYENTGAFSTSNDDIRFRQVYHGSPASLGHFDHAFTGTGEGAQAYGWGTYVTEVKGIARKYAAIGIKRGNHITYDGEPLSPVLDNEYYFDEVWRIWKRQILSSTDVDSLKRNISSVYMDGRTASAYSGRRKAFERQKQELLSDIDAGRIRIEPPRHLYTVEIPEDNGMNYLYWDRPVSAEQQGKIFLQLRKERFFFPEATAEFWSGRSHVWNSGKEFYGFLDYMFMNPDRDTDSQRLASGFLSRAGFTGIDYPAECSTGGRADGARNYVIFSEADLKITAHERFRFIGEKGASRLDRSEGASLRLENLAVAREMEKSGKDAGTIKAATGWERGADSKWRYETADFEYHPAGDLGYSRLLEKQSWHGELENLLDRQIEGETLSEAEWKRFEKLTELAAGLKEQDALRERIYLDDYVKDDELFQAYPEMKRTRLEFVDLPSADYCGGYLHPDNRIVINISRTDDVRSVLAHEIQHAIQTMEGFARGSNPGEFKNTVENVILDIVRATDGRILEGGGFDNTPKGIFAALDRKVPYGTILRHYDYPLSLVAEKYGYENIFDLVNDIGRFKSGIQEYRSTAGEVEARNVESRLDFTSAQRRNTLAVSTEDIARNGQIFLSRDVRMDEFARHVSFLAGKLHVPVEVIRRADEIGSPDIRGLLSCGKDIRGWYDIPSQRVCLYLPHVRGKADVERTLLHEGVAHYGLRKLAGHKHMDAFLDDIFNGCGEKVRDEILRMAAADRTDIRVATEEYLARMAEDGTDQSLWDRIVTAFRNLLRKLGFCLEIGTRELRGILAASRKNLIGIAEPTVIQTARGDLELSCGYGRAVLRRQGVETDVTSLLERMRKAGISPASLGQEDWKAVFNGGIILPGGRKLMAVREPAGYGMRISGVSPGSTRESGMEM
ncbi:LPD23 domain-containing protein [Phocaeicola vulgatus]|uniref:LPD23 domain-containing protein n=1 Tax=Phocaeicola vulgatus TaxID=821 RepID=UPI001F2866AE|nr:LPD23 domain-containing protein [Phocaeicola vulgatus]MCG0296668.1 hypothetical protein [Phocaeicola vulgatus]